MLNATPTAEDLARGSRPGGRGGRRRLPTTMYYFVAALLVALAACESQSAAHARDGGVVAGDRVVTFAELANWTYVDGLQGAPQSVVQLSGQRITMRGYLLPIEGVEALLVGSLEPFRRPCPDVDVHEIVRVTLHRLPSDEDFTGQVTVTGMFTVGATVLDGYCVDIYQIRADGLERK